MNATLVSSPPTGDFAYVSALLHPEWQAQLDSLICQGRPVTYDHWPLRQLPEAVLSTISQHAYQHLTLTNDRWQHFFIPTASAASRGGMPESQPPEAAHG